MFVVDASAVVHALIGTGGDAISDLIIAGEPVAPYVVDLEVVRGLLRAVRGGTLDEVRAREALADFSSFPIERYSHEIVLGRIWELRQNITTYDAAYVALAERLDVPLLTRDRRLANATGHAARIEYID